MELNTDIMLHAYDSGNGIVGPLENSAASQPNEYNNTVSVRPELPVAVDNLNEVRVVPNPYIYFSDMGNKLE